jgi:hypothetical protein
MKIGIVGSRRRNKKADFKLVETAFLKEKGAAPCVIVSGGCLIGADHFAEVLSDKYNCELKIFSPNWSKYGNKAGPIRNTDIARESDVLIACVSSDRTGGTEDTIKKFKRFYPDRKLVLV